MRAAIDKWPQMSALPDSEVVRDEPLTVNVAIQHVAEIGLKHFSVQLTRIAVLESIPESHASTRFLSPQTIGGGHNDYKIDEQTQSPHRVYLCVATRSDTPSGWV